MLNAEKYKEEILRVKRAYNWRTGIYKGKIVCCTNMECDECDAHTENGCEWTQWLLSEYKPKLEVRERETKFKLFSIYSPDRIITVKGLDQRNDGTVYVWCEGVDRENNFFYTTWQYDTLNEYYQNGELILC